MLLRGLLVGIILLLGVSIPALSSDSGEMPDWHVIAGGELMFARPADFGLAVHWDQLLVKSMIPPCDDGFDYCIYYYGDHFAGTNFRSAGVRIQRREDLDTESSCLFTPPRGYINFQPTAVRQGDGFAVSTFAPLFDGAVGHYADGELFRLSLDGGVCFEVETRIGASQFAHYPECSIREFTQEEREALEARLYDIVRAIRLVDSPSVVLFPVPEGTSGRDSETG